MDSMQSVPLNSGKSEGTQLLLPVFLIPARIVDAPVLREARLSSRSAWDDGYTFVSAQSQSSTLTWSSPTRMLYNH
jgi:hypothetical protein